MSAFPWQPSVPYSGSLLGHTVNSSGLVAKYEAAFSHPPTLEGVYFSEALVAADAIADSGSLNANGIRNALRTNTFQTPMGDVSFTQGGQWVQSGKYMLMMQWQNTLSGGVQIQALQVLKPTTVTTTNYIIYPFSWTNQAHAPWP